MNPLSYPQLLRECAEDISLPLFFIFNLSLVSGVFPSKCKTAKVHPVFKRKGDRNSPIFYQSTNIAAELCILSLQIIRLSAAHELLFSKWLDSRWTIRIFVKPVCQWVVSSSFGRLACCFERWSEAIHAGPFCRYFQSIRSSWPWTSASQTGSIGSTGSWT